MIKIYKRVLSVIFTVALLAISVISAQGITLYEDGDYVFADTGENTVALYNWKGTGDLSVPNAFQNKYVSSVFNYAFMGNKNINSLDFSKNYFLNEIGIKSFFQCSSLSGDVVLPNTISKVGLGAFEECTNLKSMTLNGSVTVIPQQFCYNDYLLKEVNLPTNLEKIEMLAFANCYSLRNVYIPESVTEIHEKAFDNCGNLVILCRKNTYALQYAEDNKIDHIILDGDKLGDVNGDGVVDIFDATEIQKYAAESTDFTPEQFELGDINRDGYCDVIDALLVQKSVIGAYELPQNIIRY